MKADILSYLMNPILRVLLIEISIVAIGDICCNPNADPADTGAHRCPLTSAILQEKDQEAFAQEDEPAVNEFMNLVDSCKSI